MLIPGCEGYRYNAQFCAGDEQFRRHPFSHSPFNTVVSGFTSLAGMLLKAANNCDSGWIILRIEEKLWAEAGAVSYGFFR
ncbi:hypothetical protein D3C81_1737660 [compost metagenome]